VTPPVGKALNRLARTSWDEIQTRLSQEFSKRADYALYRLGVSRGASPAPAKPVSEPDFFFRPHELSARVALIKQHLPLSVEDTIREAKEILRHRFTLLGYEHLDYGAEIDWHLDAVHGKRAPLKPWYKINFLDFEEVGDHKVTWELNRHQHLVTLAKAWAFSGDERYINEISQQFYSWQLANPYPVGINWGSSLEVAFRSLSWLWVRKLLASHLSESFDLDLLRGLAQNGKYIERFLSTYFSPNTHLIGEAVALFFIGTLCPEIPSASGWQQKGLKIVLAESERQVRPDGVYFEQSLYYHVYALDFFLHTRALAAANQIQVPGSFDLALRRMLNVLRALSGNGPPLSFGDDDGGRLFNPRRDRAEHMSDPLAVGAALYQDRKLSESAPLTEEAIWLFGESAVAQAAQPSPPTSSTAFPDGGLYLMASPGAQMLLDAGPHGSGRGGHGHADALSLRLSINGRPWLIDPGSYVYVASKKERQSRDQFRGTAAHNTLRVDRLDQAIIHGPFSWELLPDVRTEEWIAAPRFDFFSGMHDGYTRLSDPVVHRRMIFHLRGEYCLVRDVAEGEDTHELELSWHFAPELQVSATDAGVKARDPGGESLALLSAAHDRWDPAIESGYCSPVYGKKDEAPVAIFRSRVQLPAEHATMLLPLRSAEQPGTFRVVAADRATAYTYEHGRIIDTISFGGSGAAWSCGPFHGDSEFLFARTESGEIDLLIFCRASFVELNGRQIFRSETAKGWLQWTRTEGLTASDPTLLKFFDQKVLRNRTAVPLRSS
jgi:hypothetical protein